MARHRQASRRAQQIRRRFPLTVVAAVTPKSLLSQRRPRIGRRVAPRTQRLVAQSCRHRAIGIGSGRRSLPAIPSMSRNVLLRR
jgi:hypothetical protein